MTKKICNRTENIIEGLLVLSAILLTIIKK
jgi:hypothetical protein